MNIEEKTALLTEQLTVLVVPIVLGINVGVVITALYGVMIRLTTYAHPELSEDDAARKISKMIIDNAPRRA